MSKRHWVIPVLAVVQWLLPVASIFLFAAVSELTLMQCLETQFSAPWAEQFRFFGIPFLAGAAIWAVRIWSYPVFLGCLAFSAYYGFLNWRQYPDAIPLWLLVTLYSFDLLVVSYFLIPQVRAMYFNKRLRWWQSLPRYSFEVEASCKSAERNVSVRLENISMGGAFIAGEKVLQPADRVQLNFHLFGHDYSLFGEVVYFQPERSGFGIKFDHTRHSVREVRRIVRALHKMKVPRRPEYTSLETFFVRAAEVTRELFQFLKTGRGVVPKPAGGPKRPRF